jgi:cyclophilin family peptidyl-prolyl cis-trans isomerase
MKNLILFFLLIASVFAVSCGNAANNSATKSNANASVKTGVKPVADEEIAVIETDYGTIKMEFYSNLAPQAVSRFKELAREGFYNGTTFHRINPNFGIIQGGDPLSKDNNPANDGTGNSDKPNLPAEFSDVPYERGIVGAARTTEPNTANSQFFIMTKRQPAFDKRYTVFGKVIEDQKGAVDLIAGAPTADGTERPAEKIIIKSVSLQKR